MFGGGPDQAGMGMVLISELCRVSSSGDGRGRQPGAWTVPTIQSRGTLAQQERWLPGLVTYEKVGAWAITEPDSGSDAFGGMKSYVVRDGDDYILNGQKTFITNGPDVDVVVVYAKLDEGDGADKRDRKVLTFVLDRGMGGLRPVEAVPQDGHSLSRAPGSCSSTTSGLAATGCSARPRRTRQATAATAPGRWPSVSASCPCRWASSRNVCGCASTTPRPARCGQGDRAVPAGSSSSWPAWRWRE